MLAPAALALDSPQGLLTGALPDGVGAKKRVAVGTFMVQFVTRQSVESKKSNDVYHARVEGLSAEAMQKIADTAYDQFVSDLRGAGLQVVDLADVLAHPATADLAKAGRKSPAEIVDKPVRKTSQFVSAKGLPLVLAPVGDVKLDKYATDSAEGTNVKLVGADEQNRTWMMPSNGETFSLGSIYGAEYKLAEALDATVVNVRLTLSLVNVGMQAKVGGFGIGLFSGGEYGIVTANPRLVESGTVFGLVQNTQFKSMGAKKPMPLADLKPEIAHVGDGKVTGDGGLIGMLMANEGDGERGTARVKVNADQLGTAMNGAASNLFKDLAQTLLAAK
jgi:hypothetical protein